MEIENFQEFTKHDNNTMREILTNETYELYDRNIRLWGKSNQIR